VRWVRANFPDAVEIKSGFGFDALKNTFRAMLDGAWVIYQPQLWDLRQESRRLCIGKLMPTRSAMD
jgi:hypothetical protein